MRVRCYLPPLNFTVRSQRASSVCLDAHARFRELALPIVFRAEPEVPKLRSQAPLSIANKLGACNNTDRQGYTGELGKQIPKSDSQFIASSRWSHHRLAHKEL